MTKKQQKAIDQRIERIYYKRCAGVQINVMDIGKVFKTGQTAIAADPQISDEVLGNAISPPSSRRSAATNPEIAPKPAPA